MPDTLAILAMFVSLAAFMLGTLTVIALRPMRGRMAPLRQLSAAHWPTFCEVMP